MHDKYTLHGMKRHLMATMWKVACGMSIVEGMQDTAHAGLVTCGRCRNTKRFLDMLRQQGGS